MLRRESGPGSPDANSRNGFSMRGLFRREAPLPPDPPEYARLSAAAEANGVRFDRERTAALAEALRNVELRQTEDGTPFHFYEGKSVGYIPENGMFHFNPRTTESPKGVHVAHPEEATSIMLQGIRDTQDLMVAMDAGLIGRSEKLVGETNLEMSSLAQRLGFELGEEGWDPITNHPSVKLSADTAVVHDRLFSADTRRVEQVLAKRLEGM